MERGHTIAEQLAQAESPYAHYTHSSKLILLKEQLQGMVAADSDTKLILFSQWTTFLTMVEKLVNDLGIGYTRIDGSVSAQDRQVAVHNFQTEPTIRVILVSLMAGGEGLNLTRASHVVMLDPW